MLYEPSCDLSPVLALQFPQPIEILAGIPRTEIHVENGINKITGRRQPDEIRVWFTLKEGATEYTFIAFYSEAAAIKKYGRDKERNVFQEFTAHGLAGRIHYTEEPRADPGGGLEPLGIFVGRCDFRFCNLYISVQTEARIEDGETPQTEKLNNAVKNLAQMLREAFSPKQ